MWHVTCELHVGNCSFKVKMRVICINQHVDTIRDGTFTCAQKVTKRASLI